MSAGRYVFFFFFFLFGCSAIALLSGVFVESPTITATAQPTEIRQRMEGAHSRGATLFQYKRDAAGALCSYNQWLSDLDANIKEIRLSPQERINLTLCKKYDSETDGYYILQKIDWTKPGDYLVWEASGLCGLRYE